MYSKRLILLLLSACTCVLCLSPPPAFSQTTTSDTLPPSPYIVSMEPEDNVSEWPYVSRRRLWARIVIANPARASFILRASFRGGGRLYSWHNVKGGTSSILLHGLELRYRDVNEAVISRRFDAAVSKSEYVYELPFRPEDAQSVYNMELWGYLNPSEARLAVPGVYNEVLMLEIVEVRHRAEALSEAAALRDSVANETLKKRRR